MSRIGKNPVPVPKGVTVTLTRTEARVKGPKGELAMQISHHSRVTQEQGELLVEPAGNSRQARMMWGTTQRLLGNMITGVTEGFSKELEIIGTGYRAEMRGKNCVLRLGYSHEIDFAPPAGVTLQTPEQTRVVISGVDKQAVGQTAAVIRGFRPPEPYKGKGVRYKDEWVRRKAGKAGKK